MHYFDSLGMSIFFIGRLLSFDFDLSYISNLLIVCFRFLSLLPNKSVEIRSELLHDVHSVLHLHLTMYWRDNKLCSINFSASSWTLSFFVGENHPLGSCSWLGKVIIYSAWNLKNLLLQILKNWVSKGRKSATPKPFLCAIPLLNSSKIFIKFKISLLQFCCYFLV